MDNDGLIVGPSWISEEFSGLFSTRVFEEGEIICRYTGIVYRTSEALRLEDKSYLMRLGEQCYVDSRETLDCSARYINDCRNPAGYNVVFLKKPLELCADVVARRRIEAGEEIFVDYGKWYWAGSPLSPMRLSFGDLHRLKSQCGSTTQ